MTGNPVTRLVQGEWVIELPTPMWAELLLFLSKCGWKPRVPSFHLLGDDYDVATDVAESMAAAGRIILEETMNDPMGAHSVITFDLGKFAEIVEMASAGAFQVSRYDTSDFGPAPR